MEAFFVPLNYAAVVVAAVVNFVLGWVWFGPILGKTWVRLGGGELRPTPASILIGFLTALVVSYFLAQSVTFAFTALKLSGPVAGLEVGFATWLGFIAPITLGPVIYERKSVKLWLMNNAYWLTSLVLMGLLFAVWG